jgi:hypothetical protein
LEDKQNQLKKIAKQLEGSAKKWFLKFCEQT